MAAGSPLAAIVNGRPDAAAAAAAAREEQLNHLVAAQLNKTRMCAVLLRGGCHNKQCGFAHSEAELRVAPDLTKTKTCTLFTRGACRNGNCSYAHGQAELRVTPKVYKTQLCNFYARGRCYKGDKCRHAHGSADLRPFGPAADSPQSGNDTPSTTFGLPTPLSALSPAASTKGVSPASTGLPSPETGAFRQLQDPFTFASPELSAARPYAPQPLLSPSVLHQWFPEPPGLTEPPAPPFAESTVATAIARHFEELQLLAVAQSKVTPKFVSGMPLTPPPVLPSTAVESVGCSSELGRLRAEIFRLQEEKEMSLLREEQARRREHELRGWFENDLCSLEQENFDLRVQLCGQGVDSFPSPPGMAGASAARWSA